MHADNLLQYINSLMSRELQCEVTCMHLRAQRTAQYMLIYKVRQTVDYENAISKAHRSIVPWIDTAAPCNSNRHDNRRRLVVSSWRGARD